VTRIDELAVKIEEARRLHQQATKEVKALNVSARRTLFGETPQANWIPLSCFVAEIENGKSPQCESRPASNDEWGVLKVGAVSFGAFDERENKALPVELEFNPTYEVRSGDFLMSRANTTELVGACAIVGHTRPRLLLSDKTFRFHFRRDTKFSLQWLGHAMKSPALREQIERGASGTSPTMKNISKEKVMGILLPPHSFPEQCGIVAKLDALQAQVDALKKLQAETSAELDAMLPSILDKAFKGEL
jgi:type I restriction enzyme S subunit